MKHAKNGKGSIHSAARMYARECREGKLNRREFLTRATALGVSVPAAYGLLGLAAPTAARADTPQEGGTLRIQMDIRAQRDPRTWDWSELANVCRGWLEYLVQYERDGSLTPILLESWEANEDATEYTLRVRQGVTWNNGDAFTAEDVAHNFERWADTSVEGNSMASRMTALSEDGQLRDGAVEVVDEHTLRLHLSAPDIALIVNLADYPAAVVHPSFTGDPIGNAIGTGPYRPVSHQTGISAVIERNPDHTWWNEGNGAWLDRIEFIDLGADPSAWVASAEGGEIDMLYESTGDFLDIFTAIGMEQTEAVTSATLAVRFNQEQEPYDRREVRRALILAVDNETVLELGYNDLGTVAENHHVCPIHPEYAELPPPDYDPDGARQALEDAGLGDYEFELISTDESFHTATCDNIAAQIRAAGINIRRTVLPGATFWNDWLTYPFSATSWAMRPLGVQVLNLAYRSGEAWNEAAFSNEEFDELLAQANGIADADERREVMQRLQEIMQEEGVLIQPYWRSLFRHARPGIHNAEMHPTFEIHYQNYWKS